MLRYAPQQKLDFIAKYESLSTTPAASRHSANASIDPAIVLDPRRAGTHSSISNNNSNNILCPVTNAKEFSSTT
jgi:hypothetical protein